MIHRRPMTLAILAFLGFAAEQASAQPIAPARRPTFSGYSSLMTPGGGYFGYGNGLGGLGYGGMGGFGWGGGGMGMPGVGMMMPGMGMGGMGMGMNRFGMIGGFGGNGMNMMLQQQLMQTNQNLNNLQQFIATGVNPNYRSTGHMATFNYLGHWYPAMGGMGMGGGMSGGGMMMNRNMMGPRGGATAAPGGGAGGAPNRTAGTGIPIGAQR